MRAEVILLPVAAYLIGAIPFGFLIGKLNGVDIRKVGSGNIGATNVTRSVGKTAGKICFGCDFLKGLLPVLLTGLFLPQYPWLTLAVGLATLLGHIFPVYLKFKGGKGVATAAGVAMAMAPWPLLIGLAVWAGTFLATRYVSLASIVAAAVVPVLAVIFRLCGVGNPVSTSWITIGFLTLIALLAILRHIGNIARLLNGTENRFEKKKAQSEEK